MQTNPPPNPPPNTSPNTSGIQNRLDSIKTFMKDLKEGVNDVYKDLAKSTLTLEEQLATLNANMAGALGQTQKAIAGLRQEAAVAFPTIVGLGGSFADVQKIQMDIAKTLNTNTITLGETVSGLYAGAKAVGMSSENVGEIVEAFQSAGIQTEYIKDNMQSTVNISRSMGVNTNAVFKLVKDNVEKINLYGFQNGVDGLSRMAAQAASMRINMSDIFNFASKVFNPEDAVEMVSTFQRLGVAAGDLADPFRLMYLASEDTEELSKQVVKMTEKFTFFDEQSKQFKVLPNAKRDLLEISKATGFAYEDLIKMSTAGQKMSMLSKDFKIGGIDEESKQFIANVATYSKEKGGFTVKVKGEQKLVSQLGTNDLKELKEAQAPVSLEDLAREQLSESELQTKALNEISARLAATAAGGRAPQDFREVMRGTIVSGSKAVRESAGNVRGGIQKADKFYQETGTSVIDLMSGKDGVEKLSKAIGNGVNSVEEGLKKMADNFTKFNYSDAAKPYISSGNKIAEGASVAFDGLKKLGDKATALFSGKDNILSGNKATASFSEKDNMKKADVEKQTNVNTSTTIDFNPLKVQGDINFNMKNTDGSTTKLTQDQINQLVNNSEFQKTIQRMFTDMQTKGTYPNMPGK
jgi:hypothetical protein